MNSLEEFKAEEESGIWDLTFKGLLKIPVSLTLTTMSGDFTPLLGSFGELGINIIAELISNSRKSERWHKWAKIVDREAGKRKDEQYRQDGFFDETTGKRSKAAEAAETILKKVYDTTEEPKIDYQAYLSVNMLYDSGLDLDAIRRVSKYIDELSYRQLCIMKLCRNTDKINLDRLGNPNADIHLAGILEDIFELKEKKLIAGNNPFIAKIQDLYIGSDGELISIGSGETPKYDGFSIKNGYFNIIRDIMFKSSNLDRIPDEDVDEILNVLYNIQT